jgi:WD40 repeat protein
MSHHICVAHPLDIMYRGLSFSPDGRLLATTSYDKTVQLWDPASDSCLRTLTGDTYVVSDVAFSPDGSWSHL